MAGWTDAYDQSFEGPLLAWDDKWSKVLSSGDRARYDRSRASHASFHAFLAAIEAIHDAPERGRGLAAAPGVLGRRFPGLRVLRRGRWAAYYDVDEARRHLTGLLTVRLPADDIVARLDEARRRSLPAPRGEDD